MAKYKSEKLSIGLVARITGATLRQIDYWTTLGLLKSYAYPDHKRWRGYSFKDALRISVIVKLRSEGVNLDTIKAISSKLSKEGEELLSSGKLVAYGKKVFIRSSANEAYEAVSGQATFLFVDLEKISTPIKEVFQRGGLG